MEFLKHKKDCYGNKLLDIGCGTGGFVRLAQEFGFDATGIDIDAKSIEFARDIFGLENVYSTDLEQFVKSYPNKTYDIVTLFHVLEHISNPSIFLETVKKLLRPRGFLVIALPNPNRTIDHLCESDYPPHHLTRWNIHSLTLFLSNNGFEIEEVIVKPLSMYEITGAIISKVRRYIFKFISKKLGNSSSTRIKKLKSMGFIIQFREFITKCFDPFVVPLSKMLKFQGWSMLCVSQLKS